jgi:hypothetical protein
MASANGGLYSDLLSLATNTSFLSIHQDPAVLPGQPVWTNMVSGTNVGEIWIRPLNNRDWAVALWDRDTVGIGQTNFLFMQNAGYYSTDPENGTYYYSQTVGGTASIWTNSTGDYGILNDTTGTNYLNQNAYWYCTNGAGIVRYYWGQPGITNVDGYNSLDAYWAHTNGGVGGYTMVSYVMGRSMSFGLTNLPNFGTNVATFSDVWAQTNGMVTNTLTWMVPPNDLQLFRIKGPAQ